MSGYDSASDFKVKRSAQIMTYPGSGIPKTTIAAGRATCNLIDGKVYFQDKTDDKFNRSLTDMGDRKARSCLIWVNDADAQITVGQIALPTGCRLVHVIHSTGFDSITIDFPIANRVPANDFTLLVMASVSTIFSWDTFKHNVSHESTQSVAAVNNNYFTVIQKSVQGYNTILITVSAANFGANIQIQYSEDGINWYNDPNFDNAVVVAVAGPPIHYATTANHKFYRVQAQNNVANSNTTVTAALRLVQS